jgi:hypothetical protein
MFLSRISITTGARGEEVPGYPSGARKLKLRFYGYVGVVLLSSLCSVFDVLMAIRFTASDDSSGIFKHVSFALNTYLTSEVNIESRML